MSDHWQRYFHARQILCIRKGRGPVDLELVVTDEADLAGLALWDVAAGRLRPLEGDFGDAREAVLTADGQGLLSLRDHHGSEIGHVWRTSLDAATSRDLTPDLPPYVLRGIDTARVGGRVALTAVSEAGFQLWLADSDREAAPRLLFSSQAEAWNGVLSADGRFATVDTTDHNPGIRRFAVTCVRTDDPGPAGEPPEPLAVLTDGPDGPVRAVRFSPVVGDPRLLASTERTGFARPCVWNPETGARIDLDAPELVGDLVTLDWSQDAGHVLVVHVDGGVHRVREWDLATGELLALDHPDGAFFEPDVAAAHLNIWASHYGAGREMRLLHERFDAPLTLLAADRDGVRPLPLLLPSSGPGGAQSGLTGTPLSSFTLRSTDGTPVQLWAARPPATTEPGPLVLELHGGPNMVTVDAFSPQSQAWLATGVGFAALNYRGSVTFGRDFREGFLGTIGDRETEDIETAVTWLIQEGYAHKDQVFITGASYGGFLTLLSLGRLPELFAGGFAFVPMADWVTAYPDMNPALQAAWRAFIGGTPEELPEKYHRASPISYIGNVRAPVRISHAAYDSRTPAYQVHHYAEALQAAGGDVVLEWYDGGHQSTSRARDIADHARMAALVQAAVRGERWSTGPVPPLFPLSEPSE